MNGVRTVLRLLFPVIAAVVSYPAVVLVFEPASMEPGTPGRAVWAVLFGLCLALLYGQEYYRHEYSENHDAGGEG